MNHQQQQSYGYGSVAQGNGGYASHQQQHYQSYGHNTAVNQPHSQQAPDAQALVANLLSMLPGGSSQISRSHPNNKN